MEHIFEASLVQMPQATKMQNLHSFQFVFDKRTLPDDEQGQKYDVSMIFEVLSLQSVNALASSVGTDIVLRLALTPRGVVPIHTKFSQPVHHPLCFCNQFEALKVCSIYLYVQSYRFNSDKLQELCCPTRN